jgi:hypothetical protein
MNHPNSRHEKANDASAACGNGMSVLLAPRLRDSGATAPALTLLVRIAFCLLAACSRDGATTKTAAAATTRPSATADGNAPGNPCDVITTADVSSILSAPATRKAGADSTSCMYQTQSRANVTISVAKGDAEKGAWTLATTYNATKSPLTGVADEALYNPEGTTLIARRGDTSCRVDVVGYDNASAMGDITKSRGEALARKLGALCNKLLAAH